jgi:hypothetical protein
MNKAAKTSESTSPSTEAAPSIDAAAAVEPPRKTVGFQRSRCRRRLHAALTPTVPVCR